MIAFIATLFLSFSPLEAQLPGQQSNVPSTKAAKPGIPPDPEEIILETKDHVKLVCTYYGAPEPEEADAENAESGKTVIPFILLHDWEGRRHQMHLFGAFLQSQGHAVIVPDFRGHGMSTAVVGRDKPIKFEKFRKQEIASAVLDIERCKKFLVKQNNEGKLNIDLLCVVAVGEASVLAAQWTLTDWFGYSSVNRDGIKQGKDVKALVLVSPRKKLGSMALGQIFKNPLLSGEHGDPLPLMVVWCPTDSKSSKDSKGLIAAIEKSRPDVPSNGANANKAETKISFFVIPVNKGTISGVKLMNSQSVPGLWDYIATTIVDRINSKIDQSPWQSREKPTEDE